MICPSSCAQALQCWHPEEPARWMKMWMSKLANQNSNGDFFVIAGEVLTRKAETPNNKEIFQKDQCPTNTKFMLVCTCDSE